MVYYIVPGGVFDPDEFWSLLAHLETLILGGVVGYEVWGVHPAIAIAAAVAAMAAHYYFYRMLRRNKEVGFVKFFILILCGVAALAYGYLGYRLAAYFAPTDQIWQAAGALTFGAIAAFDRHSIIRD